MRITILFILFSCCGFAAVAQTGTLSGQVTNDAGKAIEGATVVLKELSKSAVTDEYGRFEMSPVQYGDYTLIIFSATLQTAFMNVTVATANTQISPKVKELSDKKLDEVTVQGKSEKRRIETSGFAVNVIETKEASLRNLQTNELLNRTVGIRVRQSGGIGSEATYNLNGMSGRAIGIFIDGIEISTYGSSFNLNNIPPAMIERIEVYKGVLPAHLSGDFLGGGINVILKKGGLRNSLVASASYGSFNTQQADLSGMYRDAKSGFTVRGVGFYTYSDNDYEVWGKFVYNEMADGRMVNARGRRFNDAYRAIGGRVEVGFTDVKWADAISLSYNVSGIYDEVQHGQYMTKPYMGRFSRSQAHVIGLDYKRNDILTKGLNFSFNGVYSDRKQYVEDTVSYVYNWDGQPVIGLHGRPIKSSSGAQQQQPNLPTMNTIDRQIVTLRSALSYDLSAGHKLTFNHMFYAVDRQDFDALRTVLERNYLSTSDLAKNVSSLSYGAETFNSRLRTNVFIKYYQQRIDRMDPVAQSVDGQPSRIERITTANNSTSGYGLAASYALKPTLVLIASAERAVRMPGESELFGNPAENIMANPSINPEISDNYNLGIRAGSYQINKHRISISAAGFLRDTKDKIVYLSNTVTRQADNAVAPFVNLNGVRSIGVEAELNYTYRKLNVSLNASRFNALLQDITQPYHRMQIPNEPFFTANCHAQYRFDDLLQKKSAITLYYALGYVHPFETVWQEKRVDDRYTTPAQFIQDIGASYRFPNQRLVLSIDVKNLSNQEAYDNFAVQKPGRAFYLKLTHTINKF